MAEGNPRSVQLRLTTRHDIAQDPPILCLPHPDRSAARLHPLSVNLNTEERRPTRIGPHQASALHRISSRRIFSQQFDQFAAKF